MGQFVYRGMMDDTQKFGNTFDASGFAGGSPNGFWLMLIADNAGLDDPTDGLGDFDIISVAGLLAKANVAELNIPDPSNGNGFYIPGSQTGGVNGRIEIGLAQREAAWVNSVNRTHLRFPGATQPISVTWTDLAIGATIGAFVLVRGDAVDETLNFVWFSDSAATNLPAATNNEDIKITMNQTAMVIVKQEGIP